MTTSIGIVGAGVISRQYLENLMQFPELSVDFIADMVPERAATLAQEFRIPAYGTLADLLDTSVEIVVNLTIPSAHGEVSKVAIRRGKHVWVEKPLSASVSEAKEVLTLAAQHGVVVAGAPDTFLGPGLQNFLGIVQSERWGTPITARATFTTPGPGRWHPAPEFLYDVKGGGPLFDMGPYYLTVLLQVFGPVESLVAHGAMGQEKRIIGAGPRMGSEYAVTAFTTVSALLQFCNGKSAQLFLSFDSGEKQTGIEIYCQRGTIHAPDPNRFDGATVIHPTDSDEVLTYDSTTSAYTRGIGVLEMARAIDAGAGPRAHGELALHVLEVMEAAQRSMVDSGDRVQISPDARIFPS